MKILRPLSGEYGLLVSTELRCAGTNVDCDRLETGKKGAARNNVPPTLER
jgi:hypothetical protein